MPPDEDMTTDREPPLDEHVELVDAFELEISNFIGHAGPRKLF
jgi:hypothetical protein